MLKKFLMSLCLAFSLSGCVLSGYVPSTAIQMRVSQTYGNLSPQGHYSAAMAQKGLSTLSILVLDGDSIGEQKTLRMLTFDISGKYSVKPGMTYIKDAPEQDDSTLLLSGNVSHSSVQGRSGGYTESVKGIVVLRKHNVEVMRLNLDGTY